MGFIIAWKSLKSSLMVESHLPKLVGTSPTHFLRNPVFGVLFTAERLLSEPQTTGGENIFSELLV